MRKEELFNGLNLILKYDHWVVKNSDNEELSIPKQEIMSIYIQDVRDDYIKIIFMNKDYEEFYYEAYESEYPSIKHNLINICNAFDADYSKIYLHQNYVGKEFSPELYQIKTIYPNDTVCYEGIDSKIKKTIDTKIFLEKFCVYTEAYELEKAEKNKPNIKSEKGIKHDSEKLRWSLVPFDAMEEVVKVLEYGAKKYAPDNWKHVDNGEERYFNAMMRHLVAYRNGERKDPDSGLSHISHAICSGLFLLWKENN